MLLLTNGTIATMDPARPMAEAAVVAVSYTHLTLPTTSRV